MNSYNLDKIAQTDALWASRKADIERMYFSEGMSQKDIGNFFGVCQDCISRNMKRIGIKAKPRHRTGPENGRFIDGTESRLYRRLVEKKKCETCASEDDLLVHHKNENNQDNSLENLQVLCRSCHVRHHKLEWWKRRKESARASAGAN